MSDHEHYEALMMKAVDEVISDGERVDLEAHVRDCSRCASELRDFQRIKEATDAMTQRILESALIEPPRPAGARRAITTVSLLLILAGTVILLGFAGYSLATDAEVPMLVKVGAGLAASGSLGLLAYVLWLRLHRPDPYQEVDQ